MPHTVSSAGQQLATGGTLSHLPVIVWCPQPSPSQPVTQPVATRRTPSHSVATRHTPSRPVTTLGYQPWGQVPLFSQAKKGQALFLLLLEGRNSDFSELRAYAGLFGLLSRTSTGGAQLPAMGSRVLLRHGLQSYPSMPSCLSSRCAKIVPPGVTGIFTKAFTG